MNTVLTVFFFESMYKLPMTDRERDAVAYRQKDKQTKRGKMKRRQTNTMEAGFKKRDKDNIRNRDDARKTGAMTEIRTEKETGKMTETGEMAGQRQRQRQRQCQKQGH